MERITGYTTKNLKFISTGLCPDCIECKESFGIEDMREFNQQVQSGELCNEGSFSWNPCNECNTHLGGDSYFAHGVDVNDEIIHFTVCHDCLMELNGYTWNKEIECYE